MPAIALVASVVVAAAAPVPAFDHSAFDALLRQHVAGGLVDDDAFVHSPGFRAYLEHLASARLEGLPERERLAFWINVYNASTIAQIDAHGERESVRNINRSLGRFLARYWPEGPEREMLLSGAFRLRKTDYDWTLNGVERGLSPAASPIHLPFTQ